MFNPSLHAEAVVRRNGSKVQALQPATPVTDVWLADGSNAVSVALSKKLSDTCVFDNGSFLLNVSVNGVALTQLSALRPRALVFLTAGQHVVTAANGALSTDTFARDGGTGSCVLP